MCLVKIFPARLAGLSIAVLLLSLGSFIGYSKHDARQNALVIVKAVTGRVEYSIAGGPWLEATNNLALREGTVLRTEDDSAADLFLPYSGTTLRLIPNSTVKVDSLERYLTSVENVTRTRLVLIAGSLVGSQRKLPRSSSFAIVTEKGEATIKGTEYVVRTDGAVTVLSGQVSIHYNKPGGGGSVKVTIQQGQSFDPATGTVVPTTAAYLQNVFAHVNTVRQNAETFKTGGATIVVKPEDFISPTVPNGNNGVGNGVDGQPPGNPPVNDGPGTGPGNPGNQGGGNGNGNGNGKN